MNKRDVNSFNGGTPILVSSLTVSGERTVLVRITGPIEESAMRLLDFYQEHRAFLSTEHAKDGFAGQSAISEERQIQNTIENHRNELFDQIMKHNEGLLDAKSTGTLLHSIALKAVNKLHRDKNKNEIVDQVLFQVAHMRKDPRDASTVIELIKICQERKGKLASFFSSSGGGDDRGL